jgi:glycosyltransferase involved in cell wall biosynthesis
MRVLVVSGIWPPDVGGPASHAPEVAAWLLARGHSVEAVVTADATPPPASHPVHWVRRSLPPGLRHLAAVVAIVKSARHADVVYSTGMSGRSSLAAWLARTPIVLKVTADPAFERARRRRLVAGDVSGFQGGAGGPAAALLRRARDAAVRRASRVVCPSAFMRDLVVSWGASPDVVTVLPNPAPRPEEAEQADPVERPLLVFAGRLTAQKNLDLVLAATPDVHLLVVGDGPDRRRLEARAGPNVSFAGALPRRRALGLLAAADASVLASDWENFPHGVVESLAMGTPVIATRTGGVAEIVRDGENGLLVEPGDAAGFRAAVRRYFADESLRAHLRANAAASVARFDRDAIFGRLESLLEEAAS